jgi:GcrA cell cycle regulator
MSRTWTEARIARLTDLWDQGMAARLIAVDIGLTKSAIVGKAHRLELPGRASPILHCAQAAPESKTRRQAACEPPKRLPLHSGGHMPTGRSVVHMAKMASGARFTGCQWIADEPTSNDSCKCGAAVGASRVYCPPHEARAWRPPQAPAPRGLFSWLFGGGS